MKTRLTLIALIMSTVIVKILKRIFVNWLVSARVIPCRIPFQKQEVSVRRDVGLNQNFLQFQKLVTTVWR